MEPEVRLRGDPPPPCSRRSLDRFEEAFDAGQRFLDESPTTPPRDDYHRAILAELGIEDVPSAILEVRDRPLGVPPVEPFPDVRDVLEQLRARGIRMAMVTDAGQMPAR